MASNSAAVNARSKWDGNGGAGRVKREVWFGRKDVEKKLAPRRTPNDARKLLENGPTAIGRGQTGSTGTVITGQGAPANTPSVTPPSTRPKPARLHVVVM